MSNPVETPLATPTVVTPPVVTPSTPPVEPTSVIGSVVTPPVVDWKEFTPDAAKTADENAAAKAEHDKTKPAAPVAKAEPFVPLTTADITLPEGFEADPATQSKFIDIMNDQSLDRKALVQKLVDLQAETNKVASEKGRETWAQTRKTWADEVLADPKVGGANLPAVQGKMSSLLDEYGGDTPEEVLALRQVFDQTGAGDKLPMVKFLNKLAGVLLEGRPLGQGNQKPSTVAHDPNDDASVGARRYPSMAPKT